MRLLGAAIAFLTRVPVTVKVPFDTADVGRSTRWYPLIGAMIGGVYAEMQQLFSSWLPPLVVAVLIVVAEALLTGALHMDALADAADGLGGGWRREDVLRIMRDHVIGSYGGAALILLILLKVTVIAALAQHSNAAYYLVLAPALGRWSIVPLSRFLPYADESRASPAEVVGTTELVWSTVLALGFTALGRTWHGFACWAAAVIATMWFGRFCYRKIGGVTGDTLGANIEICECVVLLLGLALS